METVYLTDITGTVGAWLDANFDSEVPQEVVSLLEKVYKLSTKKLEKPLINSLVDRYNNTLKAKHGENISVRIEERKEDDGSIWYCYITAKRGESSWYPDAKLAYDKADEYLRGLGILW